MQKTKTLFILATLVSGIGICGGALWNYKTARMQAGNTIPETEFGAFLAAQHAIYVNDFDAAQKFSAKLKNIEIVPVQTTKVLAEFLGGRMPAQVELLAKEKTAAARLIYDAHLAQTEDWEELYKRHKNDETALSAPLRIWSSVATGRTNDALKFVDTLHTNDAWKAFVRGQIHAESGNPKSAAEEFARVRTEFMNINDYMYVMSFYRAHDMNDAADALHDDFTSRAGGMFMSGYTDIPDWSNFSGHKNALAFSLLQNVSHTQIMMYSDLAILLMRFAQIVGPSFGTENDAVNYYLGQYFYNNTGDWQGYFNQISRQSPFYPFAVLRAAEHDKDMVALERMLREYPLFVPAVNTLISYDIQQGNRRSALRTIDRALRDDNLPAAGRAYFQKGRAFVNYMFGDTAAAQSDLHKASDINGMDGEILALQAKIWAAENRELETAYEYAMTLVRQNPTDVAAWDTLGRVVAAKEGTVAALELIAGVAQVSATNSALFEQLGDLYVATGDDRLARDAYMRAIELSDDGLSILPVLNKKLRNLE